MKSVSKSLLVLGTIEKKKKEKYNDYISKYIVLPGDDKGG